MFSKRGRSACCKLEAGEEARRFADPNSPLLKHVGVEFMFTVELFLSVQFERSSQRLFSGFGKIDRVASYNKRVLVGTREKRSNCVRVLGRSVAGSPVAARARGFAAPQRWTRRSSRRRRRSYSARARSTSLSGYARPATTFCRLSFQFFRSSRNSESSEFTNRPISSSCEHHTILLGILSLVRTMH